MKLILGRYLELHGIKVTLTTNAQSIYSKILVIENKNFAIYKRKNEHNDNHVTKNATTIEALTYEVEELLKNSIPLDNFIRQYYPLNGKWFHYTLNKTSAKKAFQTIEFNIMNSSLYAKFPKKSNEGTLLEMPEYTLILMEHSVLKIQNINIHDSIFRVSIIGKERHMYHRDVLLFGIMSRVELTEEQVMLLLNNIHKKNDESYWLKISNEFDSTLACLEINP